MEAPCVTHLEGVADAIQVVNGGRFVETDAVEDINGVRFAENAVIGMIHRRDSSFWKTPNPDLSAQHVDTFVWHLDGSIGGM